MSIYSIYFSPTGGTKKIADILAEELVIDMEIDLSRPNDAYNKYEFAPEDMCLISVPSFGGRVPAVVLERLKQINANGATAALVVVFGNRAYDDTLLELKDETTAYGYRVIAAIAAVAEHSIMRQYAKDRPDVQDKIELHQYAKKIKELRNSKIKITDFNVPGNTDYKEYKGVPFKPKANKSCTECGLCAEKCPVQTIPTNDPSKLKEDTCISCMRCISICPQNARQLNKASLSAASLAMKKLFAARKQNEIYTV